MNFGIHEGCFTRKMSDVLLLHANTKLHTSVQTTDVITNFEWTVLPLPPHSHALTPCGWTKKNSALTPLCQLLGTAEHRVPVAVEKEGRLLAGSRNAGSF
jgi:hypothetical protein